MVSVTGSTTLPSAPPSGSATGDLTGTYPAPTIAANAVTNAKMATMASNTFKANVTGSAAVPTDVATSQIPGTATNDAATAGNIGEFISATVLVGSAVGLSTGTAADITSISLTAGDWDVWGVVAYNPNGATTITALQGWISATSATAPTAPNAGAEFGLNLTFTTGAGQIVPTGTTRLSLSTTTTVFLSCLSNFGVNTMAAYGFIGARRRR